jgi:hypothetical protein
MFEYFLEAGAMLSPAGRWSDAETIRPILIRAQKFNGCDVA